MDLSEKSPLVQIGSSPTEIIRRIYNKADWISHVDEKLQYRGFTFPDDTNESLDDLICLYTNKKSKRVGYAGKKLKKNLFGSAICRTEKSRFSSFEWRNDRFRMGL